MPKTVAPASPAYKQVAEFADGLDVPVRLDARRHRNGMLEFQVVYGKNSIGPIGRERAAIELGQCLLHALECAGKLDD